FYGVFSNPQGGGAWKLNFYRFDLSGNTVAGYPKIPNTGTDSVYEPQICWDGLNFGVAYSTFTQAKFLILSPTGTVLAGPIDLPRVGVPVGITPRTAAFKPIWTGQGYAVFGLILIPQYPGQTIGNYYNYLLCWFLDPYGNVVNAKLVRNLLPVSYPTMNGEESWYL
ncbi:hypothetical protein FJY63_04880, partial [Candidatus Sumerlaeota bacterium]|nr:hypothetical protein [Candidatus Sumerlaeota bacterium]